MGPSLPEKSELNPRFSQSRWTPTSRCHQNSRWNRCYPSLSITYRPSWTTTIRLTHRQWSMRPVTISNQSQRSSRISNDQKYNPSTSSKALPVMRRQSECLTTSDSIAGQMNIEQTTDHLNRIEVATKIATKAATSLTTSVPIDHCTVHRLSATTFSQAIWQANRASEKVQRILSQDTSRPSSRHSIERFDQWETFD